MREASEDGIDQPLPRHWLPDPQPPAGAPHWDARIERIMAAAAPELFRLRSRRPGVSDTSWSVIALWWKPAAALAAAATALSLLIDLPDAIRESPEDSVSLGLIAAEGDPVALWRAFGIQADPVLALIAFHGQMDGTRQGMTRRTVPERGKR